MPQADGRTLDEEPGRQVGQLGVLIELPGMAGQLRALAARTQSTEGGLNVGKPGEGIAQRSEISGSRTPRRRSPDKSLYIPHTIQRVPH